MRIYKSLLGSSFLVVSVLLATELKNTSVTFEATGKPSFIKIKGEGTKLTHTEKKEKDKKIDLFEFDMADLNSGIDLRDLHMKEKYLKTKEFPKAWFAKAKLSPQKRDPKINFFGVDASQPLSVWKVKGWIYKEDPRGWFQWYCRYYMGRRIPKEDARQIRRWYMMRRHVGQIVASCRPNDLHCHIRQRQALLHWAYDSRKI
jgi:hypothetical protein